MKDNMKEIEKINEQIKMLQQEPEKQGEEEQDDGDVVFVDKLEDHHISGDTKKIDTIADVSSENENVEELSDEDEEEQEQIKKESVEEQNEIEEEKENLSFLYFIIVILVIILITLLYILFK